MEKDCSDRISRIDRLGLFKRFILIVFLTFLVMSVLSMVEKDLDGSQYNSDQISIKQRSAIVRKTAEILKQYYVYEDIGETMAASISNSLSAGKYDVFSSRKSLALQLTKDIQAISKDKHLKVFSLEDMPQGLENKDHHYGTPEENFGFKKVEILPANIGYINFVGFRNAATATPTAMAAMNFVAHCDVLIIDLRNNGGGDTSMLQLLCSYFFDDSKLLSNTYIRGENRNWQEWSFFWVRGPKLIKTPLFLLIGKRTFSAAEAFANIVQNSKRGIVIGKNSYGGAHSVYYKQCPEESIVVKVSYGRPTSPGIETDFEGTGIKPDIEASHKNALKIANIIAIENLLKKETDVKKRFKLNWALLEYKKLITPLKIGVEELKEYIGDFGTIHIKFKNNSLYYNSDGGSEYILDYVGEDLFSLHSESGFSKNRIKFNRDENNEIFELIFMNSNGKTYPPDSRTSD